MAIRTAIGAPHPPLKRVLVADDDRSTVRLIQQALQREGVGVWTAYDGEEALKVLQEEELHLVILDVLMPVKDGFQVLKEMRADPALEDVRVVVLTAKAQDKDVFEGYHYGADVYLTKPFNMEELLMIIRMLP